MADKTPKSSKKKKGSRKGSGTTPAPPAVPQASSDPPPAVSGPSSATQGSSTAKPPDSTRKTTPVKQPLSHALKRKGKGVVYAPGPSPRKRKPGKYDNAPFLKCLSNLEEKRTRAAKEKAAAEAAQQARDDTYEDKFNRAEARSRLKGKDELTQSDFSDDDNDPPLLHLSDDSVKDPSVTPSSDDDTDDTDQDDDTDDDDDDDTQKESQKSSSSGSGSKRGTPSRKRTSAVWEYFIEDPIKGDKYVICQYVDPVTHLMCQARIKRSDQSTTGLLKHLRQHKPAMAKVLDKRAQQVVLDAEGTTEVIASQKNLESATNKARDILGKAPLVRKLPKTKTLHDYFESQPSLVKYAFDSESQKRVDLAMMTWIARLKLPISIVDHPATTEFMGTVHNKALVKSSATFRKRVCPLLHKNVKTAVEGNLAKNLATTYGAAITTDHWTSRAYDNYQSLTLHFIDEDFKLHKIVVEITPFKQSHHATFVESVLNDQILRIPYRHDRLLITAVTDSASVMIKATNDAVNVDEHVRCIAHLINNACEAGFKEALKQLVTKCKELAAATHKSSKTCNLIRQVCQDVNISYKKIIQPVKTRWNSMAMTMESILKLREALQRIEKSGDRDSSTVKKLVKAIPTTAQFEALEALAPHLDRIKMFSERLTADKKPTIHLVISVLVSFQAMKSTNTVADNFLKAFQNYLSEKASNCGRNVALWRIGAFLHPKFKGSILHYREAGAAVLTDQLYQETKLDIIQRVQTQLDKDAAERGPPAQAATPQPPPLEKNISEKNWFAIEDYLKDVDLVEFGTPSVSDTAVPDIRKELDIYLFKLPKPAESDCDILSFWKSNESVTPLLAKLARAILCIPASSASSERLFSAAGKIITPQRTNISAARAQELIYISENYEAALPYIKKWDLGLPKKSKAAKSSKKTYGSASGVSLADPQPGPSSAPDVVAPPPGSDDEAMDANDEDWNYSDVDIDLPSGSASGGTSGSEQEDDADQN